MIIVKLQGGLGNQMFQYAAALGVAAAPEDIFFDLHHFESNKVTNPQFTARKFELDLFPNIKRQFISRFTSKTLNSERLLYKIAKRVFFRHVRYIHSDADMIDSEHSRLKYFDGFFQDERFFKHIRPVILKQYSFPVLSAGANAAAEEITAAANPVSVHIRRGDYLQPTINKYHGILPMQYYLQAIKITLEETAAPQYFIFSDDPKWCGTNLNFIENSTIVSAKKIKPWEEIFLMSLCRQNIIANSSFSWWAAWLNINNEKVVIAPTNWFVNQPTDILPSEWIQI